jgi:hypothetical protein
VLHQNAFDLEWADQVAGGLNHIVLATYEPEVAVFSELGATRLYLFPEGKPWAIPNLKEVFPSFSPSKGAHARYFIALTLSE